MIIVILRKEERKDIPLRRRWKLEEVEAFIGSLSDMTLYGSCHFSAIKVSPQNTPWP